MLLQWFILCCENCFLAQHAVVRLLSKVCSGCCGVCARLHPLFFRLMMHPPARESLFVYDRLVVLHSGYAMAGKSSSGSSAMLHSVLLASRQNR